MICVYFAFDFNYIYEVFYVKSGNIVVIGVPPAILESNSLPNHSTRYRVPDFTNSCAELSDYLHQFSPISSVTDDKGRLLASFPVIARLANLQTLWKENKGKALCTAIAKFHDSARYRAEHMMICHLRVQ